MTHPNDHATIPSEVDWSKFTDVRLGRPSRNHVLACYRAWAELVDGPDKRNLISLLFVPGKANAAVAVVQRLFHASEAYAAALPLAIGQDLEAGMSFEEAAAKPYLYVMEIMFWALPGDIPRADPHWSKVDIVANGFITCSEEIGEGDPEAVDEPAAAAT